MPRLLGAMARTAVVAGTAQATANAVNPRQAGRNVKAYGEAEQQVYAQQAPPPMQAAPVVTAFAGRGNGRQAGPARASRSVEGPGHTHRGGVRRSESCNPRAIGQKKENTDEEAALLSQGVALGKM